MPPGYDELAAFHIRAVVALADNDPVAANNHQQACLDKFVTLFADAEGAWMQTALRTIITDTRAIVDYAERESSLRGVSLEGEALVRRPFGLPLALLSRLPRCCAARRTASLPSSASCLPFVTKTARSTGPYGSRTSFSS